MPARAKVSQLPIKISVIARTLGVSGQTVRTWIRRLGITPCATPRIPARLALEEESRPKTDRAVWALLPQDAEKLIAAFRSR